MHKYKQGKNEHVFSTAPVNLLGYIALPSKTDDSITDKYFRSQLHGSCQQQLQLYQSGKFAQSGRAELLASPAATLLWGSSS